MSGLLDQAVAAARRLPQGAQDEIARILLQLTGAEPGAASITLTPTETAAIAHSRQQAARGEFASEAEIQAVWQKHGL